MERLRRRYTAVLICALALIVAPGPAALAAAGVETTGAFAGTAPDWVKTALEPAGYCITLSDGTVAHEVWLRRDFPGLETGALFGVITFPRDGQDFRGQNVKAGSYTLRYAKIPEDGDHMGASPTPTFLLLTPIAEDVEPGDDLTFKEVSRMSAKTSGTNHPAPMNLADTSAQKEFPAVAGNSMGHEVFFLKVKTKAGAELPIGLVVKGRTEHE
ncbi:MAG TPA: hypothetical protein VMT87_12125 [Vicinamibacteria bacterium]|nr:hypothetical protein [Vicinamibacteria bacterium]